MVEVHELVSYAIGKQKGARDATGRVVITSGITCADDGNGNITITEDSNDG